MHVAAKDGNLNDVTRQLDSSTNVNVKNEVPSLTFVITPAGASLLPLRFPALTRHVCLCICPPSQKGESPLHNASWNGHLEVAKLLVERGADLHAKTNVRSPPLCRVGL